MGMKYAVKTGFFMVRKRLNLDYSYGNDDRRIC